MTYWYIFFIALAAVAVVLLYHYGGDMPCSIQALPWLECER